MNKDALTRRTRMFAMPIGSDQFYELNAISIYSNGGNDGPEIETSMDDWKYIKRMRKNRVLVKFGFLFSDGQTKMTCGGFVIDQKRDPNGCTFTFSIALTEDAKLIK
jgi:hypothetical protein